MPVVDAHELRRALVVGGRPKGAAGARATQEDLEAEQHEDRHDQGYERKPADHHLVAELDEGILDSAGIESLAVGREALEQEVLDDDGYAECRQDGLHGTRVHGKVEEAALNQVAKDGHDDHDQKKCVERVDLQRPNDDQRDVRRHDAEVAMREVDQPHDAEHQRETRGEQGVQAAQ